MRITNEKQESETTVTLLILVARSLAPGANFLRQTLCNSLHSMHMEW